MDKPSDLIRRARQSRRLRYTHTTKADADAPKPVVPTADPAARHGVYSQLMRSHDRMHTRHLG